jgi:hypothetical protein
MQNPMMMDKCFLFVASHRAAGQALHDDIMLARAVQ